MPALDAGATNEQCYGTRQGGCSMPGPWRPFALLEAAAHGRGAAKCRGHATHARPCHLICLVRPGRTLRSRTHGPSRLNATRCFKTPSPSQGEGWREGESFRLNRSSPSPDLSPKGERSFETGFIDSLTLDNASHHQGRAVAARISAFQRSCFSAFRRFCVSVFIPSSTGPASRAPFRATGCCSPA